jgi:hypothetical protein
MQAGDPPEEVATDDWRTPASSQTSFTGEL